MGARMSRYTVVTPMGDEETFSDLDHAAYEANRLAYRAGNTIDVVDETTETVVYMADPLLCSGQV
jgi:predicted double-glycine peptidase